MEYSNEISVAFGALKTKMTGGIYRLDEEQYLVFTDIDLPANFRADFGRSETGDTISMIGTENKVLMPDQLLIQAGKLHCWVWLDTGEYGGKTEYHVIVPIKQRGNITDIQPTPAEQSTIDSLIAALNEGVERAETAADLLESASAEAETLAPRSEATAHYENGVFSFGIPAGLDGVSPEVIIASIQGGYSVTITDADHPTGQTFNVMDGQDAVIDATLTHQGEAADAKAVGDALGDIESDIDGLETAMIPFGGTTGQVLKKKSNTDYDTEWVDESGGGGGGLPSGGQVGDILTKTSALGAEWITPASSAEQDNTRPITAAAVYTEIGNINALLATI